MSEGKPVNQLALLSINPLVDGLMANDRAFEFDSESSVNDLRAPALFGPHLDITSKSWAFESCSAMSMDSSLLSLSMRCPCSVGRG